MDRHALLAAAGMLLFAWCAHQDFPWRLVTVAGLVLTGWASAHAFWPAPSAASWGFTRITTRTLGFMAVAGALGAAAAVAHRQSLSLAWPSTEAVTSFVLVACAIGAAEE